MHVWKCIREKSVSKLEKRSLGGKLQDEKEWGTGIKGPLGDHYNGIKNISAKPTRADNGKPRRNESIKISEIIIMAGFSLPFIKFSS